MARKKTLSREEILRRLSVIDAELKSLPKVTAGNPIQAVKWQLVCERRRLNLRLAKLTATHTRADELKLINECGGRCAKCGDNGSPSIDHKIPISKGGSDGLDNLQVLCGKCNSRKGARYGE
jgi:5-methylcytosine-specific restriction endonuclease McrA